MEDVTDTVYRRLIREWSSRAAPRATTGDDAPRPTVMFTEFTRVDAAVRTRDARASGAPGNGRLRYHESERPIVAQIWGTRPEEFRRAAAALDELRFDGIDLNMGCPVRKIRKAGACSALIERPTLAAEIIAACREGSRLPVSVKTRIGLSRVRTEEWCGFLLEQPIDALTVHPRTADQMSDGWADWREVRRVVAMRDAAAAGTVVLGNGDVRSLAHARRLVEQTGADGVMIGRGIFADPLLFARDPARSAADGAATPEWDALDPGSRLDYLEEHIRRFVGYWNTGRNYEVLKKFYRNYVPRSAAGRALLERLYETHDPDAALDEIARARRLMDA